MSNSSLVPHLNHEEGLEEQGQPKGQAVFFGSRDAAGFTVQLQDKAPVTRR